MLPMTYPEGFSYRYVGMGAKKSKNPFLYTDILQAMFLHCFQVKKHTLSITNHSKACKTRSPL